MTGQDQPIVLLVEADGHLRQVISAYLERDGCRVLAVATLTEAVAAIKNTDLPHDNTDLPHDVDMLILDLDRLETSHGALNLDPLLSLPTLLLASSLFPSPAERRPDALAILQKPFAMHELRQQVHRALRRDQVA